MTDDQMRTEVQECLRKLQEVPPSLRLAEIVMGGKVATAIVRLSCVQRTGSEPWPVKFMFAVVGDESAAAAEFLQEQYQALPPKPRLELRMDGVCVPFDVLRGDLSSEDGVFRCTAHSTGLPTLI